MVTILLSIKPEYVERIFEGTKRFEFRRRLAAKTINKIVIYSTSPVMEVVGEVAVVDAISTSPIMLWEQTKDNAGISREKFLEYFDGCQHASAYKLGEITKYFESKKLSDFNIHQAPQSFVYLFSE